MKTALSFCLLALSLNFAPAVDTPVFKPYQRAVITWVPPYETAKSKTHLRDQPADRDPALALTHVALQFWVPTADGPIRRVTRYDKLTDDLIAEWRDWAHAHGLRALLCLYNGEEKWDWPLAQSAFAKNPEKLVSSLVAEVEFHGLDGIDVDLEGNGKFEQDKAPFLAFMQRLSTELHQRQKHLFVDSFAYIWNAPNQGWWAGLFPLVDGLNSMGYEETGAHSSTWRSYDAQAAAAGPHAAKLQIGLPTHLDSWQELPLQMQLAWFEKAACGVALWDAQFKAAAWKKPEPWKTLEIIHGTAP